ncbi:MAG: DUF1611 domain-containing protein [Planctomycetes bacterium]|nr:DUF1611 domain-containing protein [Planctomycetota bacterium]
MATVSFPAPASGPTTQPTEAAPLAGNLPVKWGYAMGQLPELPSTWAEARARVRHDHAPPRPQDVLVARVVAIGEHTRIDLRDGTKSLLFEGDLCGLALSGRYATRRFEAEVPATLDELHFVCSGGVCGRVTASATGLGPPTLLEPIGYLIDAAGERVSLRNHVPAVATPIGWRAPTIVVTGSSMDAGKTTALASLANGLTRDGLRVATAKVTGTASIGDLLAMRDAGAIASLDFTNAGYASTAGLSRDELVATLEHLVARLAAFAPDAVLLEIADGLLQPETALLLDHLAVHGPTRVVVYACNDPLSVQRGVESLRRRGLQVAAVSGTVTASALSMAEAQRETDVPVLTREQLRAPAVARAILATGEQALRAQAAG